jgi:uncharacterized membrane protein (UPF0127 family)
VRRRLVVTVAAVVALVLAACSGSRSHSSASVAAATTPPVGVAGVPQGFPSVLALLTDPAGTVHQWCLLLAANDRDRARGLMDVDSLGGYDGMLFRFDDPVTAAFYMFRTSLPLSIAWYGADGAFVSSTDMAPCTAASSSDCPLYRAAGRYTNAIEVEQGNLGRLGAVAGSKLATAGACPPR